MGNIVAIGQGPGTPEGFLGRVTSVRTSGGTTFLGTVPATLEEAIPAGSFDVSFRTSPLTTKGLLSRRLRRAEDETAECTGSAAATIQAGASIGLAITATGSWSLLHGPQSASLTGTAGVQASATATVTGSGSCTLNPVQIAQLKGPGGTFFIGPIPVVITSQLLIDVEGKLSVGAQVTSGITGGYSATAGVGWTRSGGFAPIGSFEPDFEYTPPSLSASGDVQASVDPTVQVSLDGGGHGDLNLSAGLDLHADTTANPWWALTAPVSATADLNISKLGIKSPTLNVYSRTFHLAQASGLFADGGVGDSSTGGSVGAGGGSVSITSPGPQTATIGTPTSLEIQASDSDGGRLSYDAIGLPAGLAISPRTGVISGTPNTPGTFQVTVTATDATGPSNSALFTWTINPGDSGLHVFADQSAYDWSVTGRYYVINPDSPVIHDTLTGVDTPLDPPSGTAVRPTRIADNGTLAFEASRQTGLYIQAPGESTATVVTTEAPQAYQLSEDGSTLVFTTADGPMGMTSLHAYNVATGVTTDVQRWSGDAAAGSLYPVWLDYVNPTGQAAIMGFCSLQPSAGTTADDCYENDGGVDATWWGEGDMSFDDPTHPRPISAPASSPDNPATGDPGTFVAAAASNGTLVLEQDTYIDISPAGAGRPDGEYVYSPDGAVTDFPTVNGQPCWYQDWSGGGAYEGEYEDTTNGISPNGQYVVCIVANGAHDYSSYVMNLATGSATLFDADTYEPTFPYWIASDGTQVIFAGDPIDGSSISETLAWSSPVRPLP